MIETLARILPAGNGDRGQTLAMTIDKAEYDEQDNASLIKVFRGIN